MNEFVDFTGQTTEDRVTFAIKSWVDPSRITIINLIGKIYLKTRNLIITTEQSVQTLVNFYYYTRYSRVFSFVLDSA